MREAEPMAFYAVKGEDGFPRVVHAVVGRQPEDAFEITPEQGAMISADVRSREERATPELPYATIDDVKAIVAQFGMDFAKAGSAQ
jgi:hypothetical protein